MQVVCKECRKKLNIPVRMAGKRFRCPACQTTNTAPAESLDDLLETEDEKPAKVRKATSKGRKCPMCGEMNSSKASECCSCGESWQEAPQVYCEKKLLVVQRGAQLPARCVKTNEPTETFFRRQYYWYPAWAQNLRFIIGGILFYLMTVRVRQKFELQLGVSPSVMRNRRMWIAIAWIGGLSGLALMFLPIFLSGQRPGQTDGLHLILVVLGVIVGVVSLILGFVRAAIVSQKKITKNYIWLSGAGPDFLESLPVFPGER